MKDGSVSLDLRRLKLRHLLTVVEVARAGSLTRAASALHVTVPAVSKTLREVRTMLDMELFELRHGATSLTPQGEVFVAHARASLESVQRGVAEAQEREGGRTRSIRVAVMPNVALNFLPAVLQELARIDDIDRIEVVGGSNPTALQMLRHGEIDGVLGRLASPTDMLGLHFLHLYVDAVSPVVRRGHPLLRMRARGMPDLLPYTVLMPPAGTIARDEVEHLLQAGGLDRLPRRIESMSVELPRRLALTTDAVWFAQLESVAPDLAAGRLQLLFPALDAPRSPVGITTRPGISPSDAMRSFVSAAQVAAKAQGG